MSNTFTWTSQDRDNLFFGKSIGSSEDEPLDPPENVYLEDFLIDIGIEDDDFMDEVSEKVAELSHELEATRFGNGVIVVKISWDKKGNPKHSITTRDEDEDE